MSYNLKDKNIIITGGSSGIGESIIDLLLKNKANVVNIDVNDNLKTKTIITDITNNQDVIKNLNSIPRFFALSAFVNVIMEPELPSCSFSPFVSHSIGSLTSLM